MLEKQFAAGLHDLVIPSPALAWLQEELLSSDLTERACEQALRRDQAELERVERRLGVLYDDRLDGRIDASAYDKRAGEIREQQDHVRRRMSERQAAQLPPTNQAVDLMALASNAAELFVEQPGAEQQKLLHLVLENASWKGGELRMSFRGPFSELSLSNRATRTNDDCLKPVEGDSDSWRRKRDSNPREPFDSNGFQDRRIQPLCHSSVFYLT